MKAEFQNIIYDLFPASICSYVNNMDDYNEGFEFNPDNPRVLIQLLYTMQYEGSKEFEAYVAIQYFTVVPYSYSVIHKQIISGKVILLPDGNIDYDFYKKILSNISNF